MRRISSRSPSKSSRQVQAKTLGMLRGSDGDEQFCQRQNALFVCDDIRNTVYHFEPELLVGVLRILENDLLPAG